MGPVLPGLEYIFFAYAFGLLAPIPVLLADFSLIWARVPRNESAALLPIASSGFDTEGMSENGLRLPCLT